MIQNIIKFIELMFIRSSGNVPIAINNYVSNPLCQVWRGYYRDEPFPQLDTNQSNQKFIPTSRNAIGVFTDFNESQKISNQ